MPFNICDAGGNHIGIIHRQYPGDNNNFLVALTELEADDTIVDITKVETHVANAYNCKNLLGKVNRDKLNDILDSKMRECREQTGITDRRDFLVYLYLKDTFTKGYLPLEKAMRDSIDVSKIKGYLLLDIRKIKLRDGKIYLDFDLDYIDDETVGSSPPVFAKIVDYPVLHTDIMGTADGLIFGANLTDFGGRNHAHTTTLKLLSGNCEKELDLPVYVQARKGMSIQLYIEGNKINKVFCDGVIYKF